MNVNEFDIRKKVFANRKEIPYQSLIKVYLAEKIKEKRRAE
jgi:hypothetical protein